MKRNGVKFLIVITFCAVLGFGVGKATNKPIEATEVSTTVKEAIDLETECRDNNISLKFVNDIMETDNQFSIKTDTETIVSELVGYFEKYEDPYYVLLCHHYGEDKAKEMTDNFSTYKEDEYSNLFFEIEKEK